MTPMNVTHHNFTEEVLNANQLVLVDFWASWCGPCKMIAPIVDELCQTRSDLKACAYDMKQRYSTPEEMLADLKAVSSGKKPSAPIVKPVPVVAPMGDDERSVSTLPLKPDTASDLG